MSAAFLQGTQTREALRYARLAENVQKQVDADIIHLRAVLDTLKPIIKKPFLSERSIASRVAELDAPRTAYFLYENSDLLYWSENRTWPDTLLNNLEDGKLNLLGNGYFYIEKFETGNRVLVGTYLIRTNYILQNQYLGNRFNRSFELPDETELLTSPEAGTWAITDPEDHYLFSIRFTGNENAQTISTSVPVLYGISIFTGLLLCLELLIKSGKRRSWKGFALIFIILILRWIMVKFGLPGPLYDTELFSPKYYASSFLLNSPGDLLISVSVFALIISFLYTFINSVSLISSKRKSTLWSFLIILIFFSTFLYSVLINYLLSGLILNSQISFNINNIFELTGYSLAGMLAVGILLVSLYLMCDSAIRFIRKTEFRFIYVVLLFLASQGIFLLILISFRERLFFRDYGVSAFVLANSLILFITYIRSTERRLFAFSRTVLVILGFSLYAAQMIHSFNISREREKRQLLAARLENEQDLVAEYLFENIEKRLQSDKVLIGFFTMPVTSVISNPVYLDDVNRRLIRQYFGGYLGRYEVDFKYFSAGDIPINRAGDPSWNLEEFNQRIRENGRPTFSDRFFYITNNSGRIYYIGKIELNDGKKKLGTLIIELDARYTRDESGLPDLLLSSKIGSGKDVNAYSLARYQDGKLISQQGPFNYYLTSEPYAFYLSKVDSGGFTTFDNYSHLFYRFGNGLIIISQPVQGITVFITLFSYIFTCFSLTFLLLYLIVRWARAGFRLHVNFKSRIQLTVVSIVVATLIFTGIATVTYIIRNYEKAQNNQIKEKLNNVLVLVENELGVRESLGDQLSDDLLYSFTRLSNTLGVDFNVYSLKGKLMFTSQPRIYEQELMAPLMNRAAFTRLTANQRAMFIQTEKIGTLEYIAAYEPIRNNENNSIGFLNIPYFARETELKRDISSFLVALINIYVLLFSVAVLLAFFISNRITRPLRIIQESLRSTKLGKTSEPIRWKQRDEIGALINEYNRMLEELQQSAERLARSERESAWREMAKQVAHEIKNPLTPMKLGVQHLQRVVADNHPQKEQMVLNMCNTLIEQIDSLSAIATEFSHFAKMPGPAYSKIDLAMVLKHISDLYMQSEHITLTLNIPQTELFIIADREQMIRVFSNLVKNAVQAIPDDTEGKIQIEVFSDPDYYTVTVTDNGKGIPISQYDRIFVPNFTTKSGGTGLGLAMVKNIIESMNGQVWFSSKVGTGTSFYVKLARYTDDQPANQ